MGEAPARPRPWMCCCSRLRGPGTGLSGERTWLRFKPELPTQPRGQEEQGTYSCFSPSSSQASLRVSVRATTSGWHLSPAWSLREQVQQAEGCPVVHGPEQGQASVAAAVAPRGECDAGAKGGPGGSGRGHGEATMALKRKTGTREMAGATHTSCKARPLILLLCKALGPGAPGARPSENSASHPRGRRQGDKCQLPAWGERVRVDSQQQGSACFAQGSPAGRLLLNRNGSVSRNSLHVSIKLTREEGRGACRGQESGKGEGLGEGVSRCWPLPPRSSFLGAGATCCLCSQACRPRSERPGTGPVRPVCS